LIKIAARRRPCDGKTWESRYRCSATWRGIFSRSLPAPETTLLDLLAGLFDECSAYGSPEARDREQAELMREDEEPEPGEWITLQQYLVEREARRRGPG
jgi:hypothetical protein